MNAQLRAATVLALIVLSANLLTGGALARLGVVAGRMPPASGPFGVATFEVPGDRAGGAAVRLWLPAVRAASIPLPLIVYVPAWGGRRDDNAALASALASHGYVVAAGDDVLHDPLTLASTREDAAARRTVIEITTEEGRRATMAAFDRRVVLGVAKVRGILDLLFAADAPLPDHLSIDRRRVGLMGASFGGAVAVEGGRQEPRVSAVVNLDGWLAPMTLASLPLEKPLAEFNSGRGVVPSGERASADPMRRFIAERNALELAAIARQRARRRDAISLTIDGAGHADFTDELFDRGRWRQWRPWRPMIRPERMHAILSASLLAFFGAHLRGLEGGVPFLMPPFSEVAIETGG